MDASYAESLAGDIHNMIVSAKGSGLDLKGGFQSTPLNGPHIFLNYLFETKKHIENAPGMPETFKRKLKKSNVLATIDVGSRKVGIFVLCALDRDFDEEITQEDIVAGMNAGEVDRYAEILRETLKADLQGQTSGQTGNA
jgi:hypothetical protein